MRDDGPSNAQAGAAGSSGAASRVSTRRSTPQRTAILGALADSDDFRSAQEWHEFLRHRNPDSTGSPIGLATVYRTLQALADSGEVDAVRAADGENLYRRCGDADGHHHHLRCRGCGVAVEIEGPGVEEWAAAVGAKHGFSRIEHTVELTGLCEACTAKEG